MRHDHNTLQPRYRVVAGKVPSDETPPRRRQVVVGTRVVRRELGVMQCPHGEDDKQQTQLLEVYPPMERLVRLERVRPVKYRLHEPPRRDIVAAVSGAGPASLPGIVLIVRVEEDRRLF